MSAALKPEQDTLLALQLMGMRKKATDEEFAAVLSELLGTCRMEGFRIAIRALNLILDEKALEKSGPSIMKRVEALTKRVLADAPPTLKSVLAKVPDVPLQNELPPQIRPMRTREEALQTHREKHPEMYNSDGTRKGYEVRLHPDHIKNKEKLMADILNRDFGHTVPPDENLDALERATRPDPPKGLSSHLESKGYKSVGPTGKARKIDDEGRADIRRRAAAARLTNLGKHPRGWLRLIAKEYDVSDALIYQIIYSDPAYTPVPKP